MKTLYKIFLCSFMLVFLTACGSTSIKLSDYANVEIVGVDGYATVSGSISKTKLSEKVSTSDAAALQTFIDSIQIKSTQSNIKNGDVVDISLSFSEAAADTLKLKVSGTEMKVTASGLVEGRLVDVFQDVKVSFSEKGVKISNTSDDPFLRLVSYHVLQGAVMKNGQDIEIYADYDDRLIKQYKVAVTERQKTYVVSGLWEPIENFEDLTKAQIQELYCFTYITDFQKKSDRYSYLGFMGEKARELLNVKSISAFEELDMRNVKFEKAYFVYNPATQKNSITCVFTVDYYFKDYLIADKTTKETYLATEYFFVTSNDVRWTGKEEIKTTGRGGTIRISTSDFDTGYKTSVLNPEVYSDGSTIKEYAPEYFI